MSVTLPANGFTFQRFFVAHDKSPMKITTDSALLGAWVPVEPVPARVLDIGTGCGVIALMLAQRLEHTVTQIAGIDIDEQATEQCRENSQSSPFQLINVICGSVIDYAEQVSSHYDLIVSNPPYFATAVECRTEQRQNARYTDSLNHAQLLLAAYKLSTSDGRFCLVLPWLITDEFIQLAQNMGWYLAELVKVKYSENKDYSLALLMLTKQQQTKKESELCMRHNDSSYTMEFADLMQDFYLRFKSE
ncbi:tRNA1(Val) (adenine(37)-N6)-methyltransferase [Zophobihabitans entericus]|uniref:tRNA1(Val) (adenine(37)-N6)-methyltransferase n=1 Tax=Zophobihabitans entericus TaxID=1635327 RepID=A0A6G9IED0_9GAMM|nr:methyltransferase [Zophobihabitans entericus]QIQ22054.1 methyltransferase [Zophobihabitans entericus]